MEEYVMQRNSDMQWEGGSAGGRRHAAYFLDGENPADCRQESMTAGSSRELGVWNERPEFSGSDPLYRQWNSPSEMDNHLKQLKARYAEALRIKPEELGLIQMEWLQRKPEGMGEKQYLIQMYRIHLERPEEMMRRRIELTGD